MGKRSKAWELVRDDDDDVEQDVAIPQAREIRMSADGRRVLETPRSPQKRFSGVASSSHVPRREEDLPYGPVHWETEVADDETAPPTVGAKLAAKRYPASDAPMKEWSSGYRDQFLQEFIRLEGRGDARDVTSCPSCSSDDAASDEEGPVYRCEDCAGFLTECRACCVKRHQRLPFHIIKKWNGHFYAKVTLREMGLRYQLGHLDLHCEKPSPSCKDFTIMDTNGIHFVAVDFCDCTVEKISRRQQLLRENWYPATVHQPQTCATGRLLKQFHILTLTGKIPAYDYYNTLERLTDNTGVNVPKPRYKELMRMVRQYRHLKLMKRAGRGNVLNGLQTTKAGELALECPACPIPGVNLPEGWENVIPELAFLYLLMVAVDANFKAKNLLRSSEAKDPGLHTGLAYFVENEEYREHILKSATQKDISTCSGFQSMAHAETRKTTGLRCTGIAMCICARHEFIRPNGVGDLQKGERFCNIDFVVLSALFPLLVLYLLISYDIACQWKINFKSRMEDLPSRLRISDEINIDYAIPKCHLPGHKTECHAPHSLNYKTAARNDGEGIERVWPASNQIAASAKEMGPGSRHDTYDDHFGQHNWRKYMGLGALFHSRWILAITQEERHVKAHTAFTEALPDPKYEKEWTQMVKDWEKDHSKPNPYASVKIHVSEEEIKKQLADEELESLRNNGGSAVHETGPTAFLEMGMVLEETQRRVSAEAKNPELTIHETANLQQRRIQLHKRIRLFRDLQVTYVPAASQKIAASPRRDEQPEDVTLYMPSQLDDVSRNHGCYRGLADMESRLRYAQCHDCLDSIRMLLRGRASMLSFRKRNSSGQKANTRFSVALDRLKQKMDTLRHKYNACRSALEALDPDGDWEAELQVLHATDMRMANHEDAEVITEEFVTGRQKKKATLAAIAAPFVGEGRKTTSWIWTVSSAIGKGEDAQLNEALRVEWAKGRARQLRWREEVLLLKEEMRRVKVTLEWRAVWWENRSSGWRDLDPAVVEGVSAYAREQATVQRNLLAHFTRLWDNPTRPNTDRRKSEVGPDSTVIDAAVEALAADIDYSEEED